MLLPAEAKNGIEKAFTEAEMKNLLNKLQNDKNNPFPLDYWDEENKNPFQWEVVLIPPKDSIYDGGFFKVKIEFPNNYPLSKPKFYFRTKIYHLNISETSGSVCCTLKKTNNIMDYLDAVYLMFTSEQNPESPYQKDWAKIYETDKSEFNKKVKEWVQEYATIDNYEDKKPCNFPE